MKTIWKFPLSLAERQVIKVPITSSLLHLGIDGRGETCLWFAVDPDVPKYDLEIIIVGTGKDMPHVGDFLGTIINQEFVWHYFSGPSHSPMRLSSFHYPTRDN